MSQFRRGNYPSDLHLKKLKKLGTGKTITFARQYDYIQTEEKGIVDLRKTIEELRKGEGEVG